MKKILLIIALMVSPTLYADTEFQRVINKFCGNYANLAVSIANFNFEGIPLHEALPLIKPDHYQLAIAIYDYPTPSNQREMLRVIEEIHATTFNSCLRGAESN